MISILIPVLNRNVVPLVTSLYSQLSTVKEQGEIIVMDDGSSDEFLKNTNKKALAGFNNVQYVELPFNTGRNIIRNKLASIAASDTLIFLDADSSLPDELFLQRYLDAVSGDKIIMGGRLYRPGATAASSLHFHYGKSREQNTAFNRNKHPYRSFLACNFLISRQQLSRLLIDKHLQGYCHEDTFMGLQFKMLGIPVVHIDNPLYHEGIDDDLLFMKKQKEAIGNLRYLYRTYHTDYDFKTEIKLIRAYEKIMRTDAGKYLLDKMAGRENYFRKITLSSHRLFWLDLWKLVVYHKLSRAET
jgi:glycosyltransferase involved in cell wall biosynthesis